MQTANDWGGDYPLPVPIAEMYRLVGPSELYCFDRLMLQLYLPSLKNLFEIQDAFRTSDWNGHWTVVGHHHGSPFIFDSETEIVTYARANNGRWRPIVSLPGLPEFMAAIGLIEHYLETPGPDGLCPAIFDDDDDLVPNLLPSLVRVACGVLDDNVARPLITDMLS